MNTADDLQRRLKLAPVVPLVVPDDPPLVVPDDPERAIETTRALVAEAVAIAQVARH